MARNQVVFFLSLSIFNFLENNAMKRQTLMEEYIMNRILKWFDTFHGEMEVIYSHTHRQKHLHTTYTAQILDFYHIYNKIFVQINKLENRPMPHATADINEF